MCTSSIEASLAAGIRSLTRTRAGHTERWTSVTLPFTRRKRTTSGESDNSIDHAEDRVARGMAPPTASNRFTRNQFGNVWNRSTRRFEEYPMFDQQRHDIDHPHRLPFMLRARCLWQTIGRFRLAAGWELRSALPVLLTGGSADAERTSTRDRGGERESRRDVVTRGAPRPSQGMKWSCLNRSPHAGSRSTGRPWAGVVAAASSADCS